MLTLFNLRALCHIEIRLLYPAKNFCPPIYPLGDQRWQSNCSVPLICLYSLQLVPSPSPPIFASRTVIDCQPLMVSSHLVLSLIDRNIWLSLLSLLLIPICFCISDSSSGRILSENIILFG